MRMSLLLAISAMVTATAGCEMFMPPPESNRTASVSTDASGGSQSSASGNTTEASPVVEPENNPYPPTTESNDPPSEVPNPSEIHPIPVPEETSTETVEAEAGVGKRGQSLTPGSMITEPARAFFRVEQRLAFQQVEQALQFYKASNGSYPKDTDEFMELIVKPNGLQLPELPQGHRYVFDAEEGKLMVERPKN